MISVLSLYESSFSVSSSAMASSNAYNKLNKKLKYVENHKVKPLKCEPCV